MLDRAMEIIGKRIDNSFGLGQFAREYIYISLSAQRLNNTKTETSLKNDDYFKYYNDIKVSLAAGKMANRPHLKKELLQDPHTRAIIDPNYTEEIIDVAVVKSIDGKRLYTFIGHHTEQLMYHFNVSYGNIKCSFEYLKASYHTYLAKLDKHTGEAKYIGWNPDKYASMLGELYIRNEKTYHQMYHPQINHYEETLIDNHAALAVSFDATEEQCAKFDSALQDFYKNEDGDYNVLTNNCNIKAVEFLKKVGRLEKDDHPQHFHEIDKMSLLDVGNLHNIYSSLPIGDTLLSPKLWYHSAISIARHIGITLENITPSFMHFMLPYMPLPNDLVYNDKISANDSNFLVALKKLQLHKAIEEYEPQHANQIDAVGKYPIHYVFFKPDSNYRKILIEYLVRDTLKENLNKLDGAGYFTPLMAATERGTVQDMEKMFKAGSNPAVTNREGKNVAQYIIDLNVADVANKVIWLLQNAPEIAMHRDIKFNQTALERAGCQNESVEECIDIISKNGIKYDWPVYHNKYVPEATSDNDSIDSDWLEQGTLYLGNNDTLLDSFIV